jgi:hypothetical protein
MALLVAAEAATEGRPATEVIDGGTDCVVGDDREPTLSGGADDLDVLDGRIHRFPFFF